MTATRRDFLKTTLIAGAGAAAAPHLAFAAVTPTPPQPTPGSLAPATAPTRGIGQYPGAPSEFFGPTLTPDTSGTYRNLALLRPATASSSYDYNLTPQLVTDGLTTADLPEWISTVINGEIQPKWEREALTSHSPEGVVELSGSDPVVELHLGGGTTLPEVDRLVLFVVVPESVPRSSLRFTASVSDDGYTWTPAGTGTGSEPLDPANFPPDMVRHAHVLMPSIPFDTPHRSRCYRVQLSASNGGDPSPFGSTFHLGQVEFHRGNQRVNLGGPYSFTSAWKAATFDEEWVSVDLGPNARFDTVKLHWIARAAEGKLQSSNDAETWHDLQPLPSSPTGRLDEIRLSAPTEARFLRVLMTRPATPHGYILSELEVWGRGGFTATPQPALPPQDGKLTLSGGNWTLARVPQITATGEVLSTPGYTANANTASNWIPATVPATTLTSFLNINAIPDPNFGENQLDVSDSFFYADFWYRTEFQAPSANPGELQWLNFEGINWKAEVFLNGAQLGRIDGGFIRGRFDVTGKLKPGPNALAVRVIRNDTPGSCKQKTYERTGKNGGGLGADNPTFHASIGWDWISTIRGRNTGIWAEVALETTGPVTLQDPLVTSTLPPANTLSSRPEAPSQTSSSRPEAPSQTSSSRPQAAGRSGETPVFAPAHTNSSTNPTHADITLEVLATNHTARPYTGTLHGTLGPLRFEQKVSLAPNERRTLKLKPLRLHNPELWWPVGYGAPHLYPVTLRLEAPHTRPHEITFQAGIREMTSDEKGGELHMFINGRRFIPKGGNWGFGESMLRYRAREYDAAVRFHREMNFNMVRNWVGQIGDEAFFEACDRHGVVIMQDFWLANPWDGPIPENNALFLANGHDFVARIRRHASIGLYCGRNEWFPPAPLQAGIKQILAELHPDIPYIGSSADGPVSGHGPYHALPIREYFQLADTRLHSEIGAPAIPTLASVQAMMPPSAVWPQGLSWGLHDFTLMGAQGGQAFLTLVQEAYGGAGNAADWIKLGEIVSYEAYRAMFEAQSVHRMGVLLWMSHPCWPSFVWQTYDFFFAPTASYFACKLGAEPLHIQWNPVNDTVEVVNYSAGHVTNLTAELTVFDLAGKSLAQQSEPVPSSAEDTTLAAFPIRFPASTTPSTPNNPTVQLLRLRLLQGTAVRSTNFYLRGTEAGDYTAIRALPDATLTAQTSTRTEGDRHLLTTTLKNTSPTPALFVRLEAQRDRTGDRILPAIYSDGYFALLPGETKSVTTELRAADTRNEQPRITVHGLNVAHA